MRRFRRHRLSFLFNGRLRRISRLPCGSSHPAAVPSVRSLYRGTRKSGVNALPCRGIQPLSQNLRFCQLPFNKERSSVIYRSKGGKAAYGWCKAPIAKCFRRKAAQTFLLKIHRGAEIRPQSERCDFLPFRGGAAAAAEGVVIYRLPCRAALFCAEKLSSRQDSRAKQVY